MSAKKLVNFETEEELYLKFRTKCLQQGTSVKEVLNKAMSEFLKSK